MAAMPVFNLPLKGVEDVVKNENDITTKEQLKSMHLGNAIDHIVTESQHSDVSSLKFNTVHLEESQMQLKIMTLSSFLTIPDG